MKKMLSLILALAMVMSMGLASFATASADEIVTINWFTKGTKPTDYDLVMEQANAYLAEKIGVNVVVNFIDWGTEWDTFVSTMVATNEGDVDIIFTADWDNLNSHISNGYLVPLNGDPDYGNLLEEHGQAIIESINPGFISGNEREGVLYGISCNKEISANHGWLLDTTLIEKYNIDLSNVKVPADLTPIFETVYQGEIASGENKSMIAVVGGGKGLMDFLVPFVNVMDGYIAAQYDDNSSDKWVNQYESAEWVEAYKLMKEWYEAGYIAVDSDQHEDSGAEFQTGGYFATTASLKPGKGAEFSINGVASTEIPMTNTVIRTKDVGGSMLAIVEGSQSPEKAMEFIGLLESDKVLLNMFVFGLEGVHYTVAGEDRIEITEQGTNNYSMKGNAWMFGNQLMNFTTTEEAEDKWEQFEAFNAAGVQVLSLGFNYDPTNTNAIATAVRDVKDRYNLLFTGTMEGDIDANIAQFNADLYAAGLQELLDDVQAQYDAWKAAK